MNFLSDILIGCYHIFSSGDETGTKVPSYDTEMPQHDYDEVAIDKAATLSPPAAVPPPDTEVCCVCVHACVLISDVRYMYIKCMRLLQWIIPFSSPTKHYRILPFVSWNMSSVVNSLCRQPGHNLHSEQCSNDVQSKVVLCFAPSER